MSAIRQVVEKIALALEPGLEKTMGESLEMGVVSRFEDEHVNKRRLPVRAVQVAFEAGLADCMVVLTNAAADVAVAAVNDAAATLVETLRVEAELTDPVVHEFAAHEEALEQLEALHGEPTVHFTAHNGDFLFILGSGLVQTAGSLLGIDTGASAGAPLPAAKAESADVTPAPNRSVEFATEISPDELAAGLASQVPATFASLDAPAPGTNGNNWSNLLSGVEVELSAELGRAEMPLGDLASLNGSSVLTLEQLVDEPLTVYVNGALYATARLVVIDDEYGVEIVEVLEPSLG